MDNEKTFKLELINELKYGENIHQNAALYKSENMLDYEVLFNDELSYNNFLDIECALNIVCEFYDVNCAVIVRNKKPCAVALGQSIYDAYSKAFDCDPISCFYGTAAFSKPVDKDTAKHINSLSIQAVAAPDFDEDALRILSENQNIIIVKINTPLKEYKNLVSEDIHVSPFGILLQDKNKSELNKDTFKVVTKTKPTTEQIEDAVFAWKTVKHANTNAAVIAKDFKTHAISQGFTNEIAAVENALDYACDNSKNAILATDTPILSAECINSAVQGRIALIIQPGDTLNIKDLAKVCDKYNIVMITTDISNFKS